MKRTFLAMTFTILAACSSGSSNGNDGGAGSTGTAGATAGATGTAGATAGSTGTAGATAGSTGTAGATAGTTGTAGAAGPTAGTTGTAGAAGATAGTTGTAGAAGATAGTTGTAGAAGTAACTTIGHTGPNAPEVAGVGTFPTPAGGTITDGTYDLKEFRIYPPGSVDAYIRHETLKFAGNKVESAGVSSSDNKEKTASGTFTTANSTITFMITCPGTTSLPIPYTATATELWLFDTSPGNMEVHVYTKRQ
jgi:hypothetical protein